MADGVGEIHEPVVEGPLSDIVVKNEAEGEVGRLAGLERRRDRRRMLVPWMEDQLDLLAGLLLEGGDDLLDRLVLLGVVALLPPHDEVGGPRAERRQHERSGEKDGSNPHGRRSLTINGSHHALARRQRQRRPDQQPQPL